MGLFGLGGKAPKYPTISAPKITSGADYYSGAMDFGNKNFGNAMGAREGALNDINDPNYYAKFQPTSFENALADQNFKNVWPNQENYMANVLSKSGMAYSPVAAATMGKAYGDTSFNIGSFLANQGNQRAQYSLGQRMNIDPMSQILQPYAQFGAQQGNLQSDYDWQAQKQNADAQYANEMQKYMRNQALLSTISKVSPLGATLAGGGEGAAMSVGNMMNYASDLTGMKSLQNTGGNPNMGMPYGGVSQNSVGYGGGYGSQPGYGQNGTGGQAQPVYNNYYSSPSGGYGGGNSGGMGMGGFNPYNGGYGNSMQNFGGMGNLPMPGVF